MEKIKEIRFIEYVQPQLEDGNYQITVNQSVSSNSGIVPEKNYTDIKKFTVSGERFSINPSDIVSVFPPEFSLGEFSNVLPSVILTRKAMPWERSPGYGGTHSSSVSNQTQPNNDYPWLGILVFNENDPIPKLQDKNLLDLLPVTEKADNETTSFGNMPAGTYFPQFPVINGPDLHALDYGEFWSDKCQVIDISADMFNKVAPTFVDLGWLAHVREVDLIDKSETYIKKVRNSSNTTEDDATGVFAEVVSNRLGLSGQKSVAHLVSLEAFGPILPGPGGVSNLPAGIETVRIVSLKSWTFSSVSEEFTFSGMLKNVNKSNGIAGLNTLQIPFNSEGSGTGELAIGNALSMGFAAFNHQTRMGDKTVSWYHGPFVTKKTQPASETPVHTADQLTRYNPATGMFDVSYSAAWQLGRLLGLQNNSFAIALYNYKRSLAQSLINKLNSNLWNFSEITITSLMRDALIAYVRPGSQASLATSNAILTGDKKSNYRLPDKKTRFKAIKEFLNNAEQISATFENALTPLLPDIITNFLSRLKLLYGIPFNYLVPDVRMLPQESLRFFYLDMGWCEALVEGATSIGGATSADSSIFKGVSGFVSSKTNHKVFNARKNLFRNSPDKNVPLVQSEDITGFLLRSQVVAGWPGLEVLGYDSIGTKLDLLRFDQPGPDVILCIFNGTVNKVSIREHPEALHFGVNVVTPDPPAFSKSLRYLTAVGTIKPGTQIPDDIAQPIDLSKYIRESEPTVLEINQLANAILTELNNPGIDYTGPFTSAEFAVEMVEGIEQVSFQFE